MVSIIVPAYNAANFIERCILSILNQTYYEIQLIIVDDGSTDNTLKICKDFSLQDLRIKVFHKENEGHQKAREYGLKQAAGEYVVFVDADDSLIEDAIEMAVKKAKETNADIVCFNYQCNGKKGFANTQDRILNSEQALFDMLICNGLDGNLWSKLYKATLFIRENINFESKRNCDFITCAQLIGNANKILVTSEIGYCYSFIVGSQSRNIQCDKNEEVYEIEAKKFLDSTIASKKNLEIAAQFNWLKALLYVNIKFEKDTSIHRRDERMKKEKSKLRKNRSIFLHNPYLTLSDKVKYWMCYMNIFRSVYTVYRIVRGIKC